MGSLITLLKWVNSNLALSPLTEVPANFVSGKGKPMVDIIESLSGKKVPGVMPKGLKRREIIPALITQYEEMLKFLKVGLIKTH